MASHPCDSCCPCCCFSVDEQRQCFGLTLCKRQCGICPCGICRDDTNGTCWACICCQIQIDACWFGRGFLECCCAVVPCGCIAKETIETLCCCGVGQSHADPIVQQQEVDRRVKEEMDRKNAQK